jgi:iron complex transport system substrate-binding protein
MVGLVTGVAACGSPGSAPTSTPSATTAAFPVTVGSITLDKQPERIVSLSPTTTEMLFAIDAGKQVVAVDDQSNYPADAPKTDLSGFKPNAEAIAARSPDLVVLSDDMDKIVSQLGALKIPVYVAPAANSLDDTYTQIADLGRLTGHAGAATALSGQMKEQVTKIVSELPQRGKALTYFYELSPDYYTATSKTFIGSVLGQLGLTNIAAPGTDGSEYPQLSAEAIVKADPDLIFLADAKCCAQSSATVAKRPGWVGLKAVKDGTVVALDDDVASRWGPRIIDLLRTVANAVASAPTN